MTSNGNQQPRNRIRVRRIDVSRGLPRDLAPIIQLPRGPGIVMPDNRALRVVKLGVRSLQSPPKLTVSPSLADVNLRARSLHLQNNLLIPRRFDCVRHVGARQALRASAYSYCDQHCDLHQPFIHGKQFTTPLQCHVKPFGPAQAKILSSPLFPAIPPSCLIPHQK